MWFFSVNFCGYWSCFLCPSLFKTVVFLLTYLLERHGREGLAGGEGSKIFYGWIKVCKEGWWKSTKFGPIHQFQFKAS